MSVRVKSNGDGTQATSGGEEWLVRGDHPLVNDLILDTLFGFVRRFDLKVCRGVCKKWNIRTIPHMRATFKVTIHRSESTSESDRRISDFVELFRSNELGIPFAKFRLGRFSTTSRDGQKFLHLCGETTTEIDFMYPKSKTYIIENVSDFLRSCPNLKVLGLPSRLISIFGKIVKLFPDSDSAPRLSSLETITFQADNVRCPTFFEELLTATPNIAEIVVYNTIEYDAGRNEIEKEISSNLSAVLNCIEKLGIESSIQSLSLYEVRGQHIEHLRRMCEKENGFKLKSLRLEQQQISFEVSEEFDSAQIKLATVLRHTLQHLSLGRSTGKSLMEFPVIPNLKSLAVRNFPRYYTETGRVDLNEKFPALESLKLEVEWGIGSWVNGFSEFESCQTLKGLRTDNYIMNAIGLHTFHNILAVFPNLTRMCFSVAGNGGEILRQMWTHMTGLESLIIDGCIDSTEELSLDSVFTGIPTQRLLEIRHLVNELDKMTVGERREAILKFQKDHSSLPSIRSLSNLTDLTLNVTGGRHRNLLVVVEDHLSDLTAYLAFYSMTRLRHLDVLDCIFSRTCCETLKNDMGLETWAFRNPNFHFTLT